MSRYMLDTNIFDRIAKGLVSPRPFAERRLVVTHIQYDELAATQNVAIREKLLECIDRLSPEKIPTKSAVWNVSKWNACEWGDDTLYTDLFNRLQQLDAKAGKKRNNQDKDCLISETAIKHSLILVTADADLRTVTVEHGGTAISLEEFMNSTNNEG